MVAPIIGLVGGIGSGKSVVAAAFARHGCAIIDADKLGHDALREPALREQIVAWWGTSLLDHEGQIQRRLLGKIVFADDAELKRLEGLVLPFIGRRIEERIAELRQSSAMPAIILDAPIMLETGWDQVCDHVVFVEASRLLRLARVQGRNGWGEAELNAREARQLPLEQKRARADAIVENSTTTEAVEGQVEKLLKEWQIPSALR